MDIYDFDYQKKHFKNRAYAVYPLSKNGFNQYLSNESYTHKYIDPNPPKDKESYELSRTCNDFTKRNFPINLPEENDEKCLYDIHYKNNNDDMLKKKYGKYSYNIPQNPIENNITADGEIHYTQRYDKINDNKSKEIHNNKNNYNNLTTDDYLCNNNNINNNFESNSNSNFNSNNNDNNTKKLKIENNFKNFKQLNNTKNSQNSYYNTLNTHNSYNNNYNNTNQNSNNNYPGAGKIIKTNFSISTEKGFNYKKSNLNPLKRRLNYTSSNFLQTNNNENTLDNENFNDQKGKRKMNKSTSNFNFSSRYDKNYLKNVSLFVNSKSYMDMNKIKDQKVKKYDGFQSYAVPNLNNLNNNNSTGNNINNLDAYNERENFAKKKSPVFNMTQKISKSIGLGKGNNNNNANNYTENNINETNDNYENEKLKKIMYLQTNEGFLKENKIPEIQRFIEQPKMKINSNSRQQYSKNLGEAYNPYNYLPGRDCETRRRNVNGGLFNH